jgi:hypothetical protein
LLVPDLTLSIVVVYVTEGIQITAKNTTIGLKNIKANMPESPNEDTKSFSLKQNLKIGISTYQKLSRLNLSLHPVYTVTIVYSLSQGAV